MSKTNFSIMTLNIHNFKNSDMIDSENEIKKIIKNYDIIALQEVYDKKKFKDIVKGYNYSYNRGTLLMTKYSIKKVLRKNINSTFTSLVIVLPGNYSVLVTNIHLNYENENIRLEELEDILEIIEYDTFKYPSILLGDFNSLTKSDYTQKEWAEITKIRKYGQWEIPVSELTNKLNSDWLDTGKEKMKITCRYNTRIDYIYTKNIKVVSYDVIDTMPRISDHNLVTIRFN